MLKHHILYTKDDFTPEEFLRRNVLAVAVVEQGRLICKRCGKEGEAIEKEDCKIRSAIRGSTATLTVS